MPHVIKRADNQDYQVQQFPDEQEKELCSKIICTYGGNQFICLCGQHHCQKTLEAHVLSDKPKHNKAPWECAECGDKSFYHKVLKHHVVQAHHCNQCGSFERGKCTAGHQQ